jgi:hypothetical protein
MLGRVIERMTGGRLAGKGGRSQVNTVHKQRLWLGSFRARQCTTVLLAAHRSTDSMSADGTT